MATAQRKTKGKAVTFRCRTYQEFNFLLKDGSKHRVVDGLVTVSDVEHVKEMGQIGDFVQVDA